MISEGCMRRLLFPSLILLLIMVPFAALAQNDDPALQPLAFLSGRWTSSSSEGQEEEYWSQATGKSMVGTFRALKDGDAVFYEFWVIEVEDGKAIFKMKHFDRGLHGWEEKADVVRLALSVSGEQDVSFSKPDGSLSLRYQRNGDELAATLRRVKDGKAKQDIFHLHRSKG
jgi:Domain of unknown function (DUF6265)